MTRMASRRGQEEHTYSQRRLLARPCIYRVSKICSLLSRISALSPVAPRLLPRPSCPLRWKRPTCQPNLDPLIVCVGLAVCHGNIAPGCLGVWHALGGAVVVGDLPYDVAGLEGHAR